MEIVKYADTNLPDAMEIRETWCFGLPLTKEDGTPMPDSDIDLYIASAIANVERRLGVFLKPTIIATNPLERGLEEGVDYEVEEPAYDYEMRSYQNYGFLQLRERPVQKILDFKLTYPNGQVIVDFMKSPKWLKLYGKAGQVHIVPYAGDPTIMSALGTGGYAFITGNLNTNIPQMIYVDYVAGYPKGRIPSDIRDAVAKLASINVLGIAGDALMAGVASMSTSIDGLSESVSTTTSGNSTAYSAHIAQYQKEVDSLFSEGEGGQGARSSERGFTLGSL